MQFGEDLEGIISESKKLIVEGDRILANVRTK